MQDMVNEELIISLDRHIKLFLTYLTKLEIKMNKKSGKTEKKLKAQSTSNFSALLNITTYMRDYSPLHLYWEGGFKEEGILKYIKPLIKHGAHQILFAENTLSTYYKDRFLHSFLEIDLKENNK